MHILEAEMVDMREPTVDFSPTRSQRVSQPADFLMNLENLAFDTESRNFNETIAEEDRNRLVIELMVNGIWEFDILENRYYLSERSLEILGLPKNTIFTSQYFRELLHPE